MVTSPHLEKLGHRATLIMTTVTSAQVSMLLETVYNDDNDDNDNDHSNLCAGVHVAGDCV